MSEGARSLKRSKACKLRGPRKRERLPTHIGVGEDLPEEVEEHSWPREQQCKGSGVGGNG